MHPLDLSITSRIAAGEPGSTIYAEYLAANDFLIRYASGAVGQHIVAARTAIHTCLFSAWLTPLLRQWHAENSLVAIALGGTGRGEMAPHSDFDVAYVVIDHVVARPILDEIERQTVHSDHFHACFGFNFRGMILSVEDVAGLSFEQTTSLIDLRYLCGAKPVLARFRNALKHELDPLLLYFQHEQLLRHYLETDFQVEMDLKECLRRLQAALWLRAAPSFRSSSALFDEANEQTRNAYWFLHRVRGVCHLLAGDRQDTHGRDRVTATLLTNAAQLLRVPPGPAVVEWDLDTRLRHAATLIRDLAQRTLVEAAKHAPRVRGESISVDADGLIYTGPEPATPEGRSDIALTLLTASQRYGRVLSPTQSAHFANAMDWFVLRPAAGELLTHPGLAEALILAQRWHLLDAIFVGSSERTHAGLAGDRAVRFAALVTELQAVDACACGRDPDNSSSSTLRASALSISLAASAADAIGLTGVAAVRLALVTLYCTIEGEKDASREDLTTSFERLTTQGGCEAETAALAQFLITHRDLLAKIAQQGINDTHHVAMVCAESGTLTNLQALFLLTCVIARTNADHRALPYSFNLRELYLKALNTLHTQRVSAYELLRGAGFDEAECAVLADLGPDFYSGAYAEFMVRIGSHALNILSGRIPAKALLFRVAEGSVLAVVARNVRGLAAAVVGALRAANVTIAQAHLFTASQSGFVLDFFHVEFDQQDFSLNAIEHACVMALRTGSLTPPQRPAVVSRIWSESDGSDALQRIGVSLSSENAGLVDVGTTLLWLTASLSRDLDADIHVLVCRGSNELSVGFKCPLLPDEVLRFLRS